MNIKETLNRIRPYEEHSLSKKQMIINIILFLVIGIVSGIAAKYMDTVSSNNVISRIISIIGNIFSRIGVWVLIATIISAWSKTPISAALNVFIFFCGMVLSYYIYSMKLFGFFPMYYFIRWWMIALLSPFGAYVTWYSRGQGWIAAICTALPIGLLMSNGYRFLYLFNATSGFDILAAIFLYFILPTAKEQLFKILSCAIVITYIIRYSSILNYIFGGL
ncbi:putative membrane-anchored protein [Clostridium tetanomorphum]|uniref:Uncharacterized protein n=1 Tax=Clostridium tetanomorphum TaxID=1553 RepID=A0A923J0P2_CLOTT|nr:DUF6518 family protein [Clostridium tetanomorphum]KAJ52410.1 hypothetical protein CTM_07926 [Clostridium tetanomorphum DSM 665]MBC2397929.1 hypothetical protein [Clostridium tetanomorphum]MBP1864754.1 putative membrane-anchored protein [Clostridium tetanomorphum]NRS83930.1 putative membrane-anchored protein [Clostridium tetanomorphum]NRZ97149.1 hypothetical protein [Clostridium tetanomorphum]